LGCGGLRQRKQGSSGEPEKKYFRFHFGFSFFEIRSMREVGPHLLEPAAAIIGKDNFDMVRPGCLHLDLAAELRRRRFVSTRPYGPG
jgi:hypothetical protein